MIFRSHTPNQVRAKGSKIKLAFYDAMDEAMNVVEGVACLLAVSLKPLLWLSLSVALFIVGWLLAEPFKTP